MAARSIWKGSISFGLVNIPIKLYSAAEDRAFSFNQLCGKGHRIQYKRWCPVEGIEVPYQQIQKGYEISKDNYALIQKEELENIKLKTTKTVDIKEFVDAKEIDPIFVQKSYYVAPDSKTADKAYLLLVNILKNTDKVAIGKVVLREREQLVALRAFQRGIIMHILHYLDEIRPMEEIKELSASASNKIKLEEQELALGKMLVEQLGSDRFDISNYSDAYTNELEKLLKAKSEGKLHTVKEEEPNETTKDLLEALKASVTKSASPRSKHR
ncbi:MAG TPA: Ku protein [Nitrososphaera sp.]|nr:Ku protein [Nitrososphaera sp.]